MRHDYLGQQDAPLNAVMSAASQHYATLVLGGLLLLALAWGAYQLLSRRDARLLICMLAAFAAVILECHTMGMLKFIYPPVGQQVLYTGFGRSVPVFTGLMYSFFFGYATYAYLLGAGQWSARGFWIGIVILIAAEAVMEIISIRAGLWAYYDDQPFVIADFPIHVAVIVACMSLIYGAIARLWFERVHGLQQLLLVGITPLVLIATFTVFTYPVALGLEAQGGIPAARAGSLASMLLCLLVTPPIVKRLTDMSASNGRAAAQT